MMDPNHPLISCCYTTFGRLAWHDHTVGHGCTTTIQAGDIMLCTESSCMARSTRQVLARLADGITQRVRVPLAMHQRMPVCALCSAGTAERVAGPCVPTSLLLVQDGRLLRDPIMHCVSK